MTGRTALYVFGAGGHGRVVAEAAQATRHVHGFLDDDPNKIGKYVRGVRVFGGISQLSQAVSQNAINLVITAIPSATGSTIRRWRWPGWS